MQRWFVRVAGLVLLAGLSLAGLASAADRAIVHDKAKVFSPEAIEKANKKLADIKRDYNKDVVIETFASIPSRVEERFGKRSEKQLFEKWALSEMESLGLHGVYVLICLKPGFVQVDMDRDTVKQAFTRTNSDDLVARILSKFKTKQYDEALLETVDFIASRLESNLGKVKADSRSSERSSPAPGPRPSNESGWFNNWFGWLCLGLVALLVIWVLVALFRAFTRPSVPMDGPRPGYGSGYGGGPGSGYGGGSGGGSGGGGGGFFPSLLGGMFGAAAGSWLYDSMFRGSSTPSMGPSSYAGTPPASADSPDPYVSGSGGAFDADDQPDRGGGGGSFDNDDGGGGGSLGEGSGGSFDDGGGGDFGGGGGDFGGGGGDLGGGGSFGGD